MVIIISSIISNILIVIILMMIMFIYIFRLTDKLTSIGSNVDFVVQKLDHEDEEGGLEQACSQVSLHQHPKHDDACDIMKMFPKTWSIVIIIQSNTNDEDY